MRTEFGNLNDMTLSQYETAISYFESKIEKIKNDPNIENSAKSWFLTEYGARLKILKENMQDLQEVIEEKRESEFVNDRTATFENLGERYRADNSETVFGRVEYENNETKFQKVMRVLSIVTGVGLIPTIVKLRRRKKQRLAVEAELSKENLSMKKFMRENEHPYDSIILSKTEFSDEQKEDLLENPAEISRLEALLSSPALNSEEKANVKAHLQALRKFAQEKGIALDATTLADASLATEKDKADKERQTMSDRISAIAVDDSLSLAELDNLYSDLMELKVQVNKNSKLKKDTALVSSLDSKIAEIKAISTEKINDASTNITTALESKKPTGTSKASYENSNSEIASVLTTMPASELGVSLEEAKTIATKMGISTNIDSIQTKHDEIKSENNAALKPLQAQEKFDSEVAEFIALVDELNSATAIADERELNALTLKLNTAISLQQRLYSELMSGKVTDSSGNFLAKSEALKGSVGEKVNGLILKFTSTPNPLYSSELPKHLTNIELAFDAGDSVETMNDKLSRLNESITFLSSPEIKNLYESAGKQSELDRLINGAKSEIQKIQNALLLKELNIVEFNSKLDTLKLNDTDSKEQLSQKKVQVEEVLATIENDNYRNTPEGRDLINKAKLIKLALETQMSNLETAEENKAREIEEFKSKVNARFADISTLLAKYTNLKKPALKSLVSELNALKAEARRLGLTELENQIQERANTLNSNHDLGLTL